MSIDVSSVSQVNPTGPDVPEISLAGADPSLWEVRRRLRKYRAGAIVQMNCGPHAGKIGRVEGFVLDEHDGTKCGWRVHLPELEGDGPDDCNIITVPAHMALLRGKDLRKAVWAYREAVIGHVRKDNDAARARRSRGA